MEKHKEDSHNIFPTSLPINLLSTTRYVSNANTVPQTLSRKKHLFASTHDIKIDIIEIENVNLMIDITPPW